MELVGTHVGVTDFLLKLNVLLSHVVELSMHVADPLCSAVFYQVLYHAVDFSFHFALDSLEILRKGLLNIVKVFFDRLLQFALQFELALHFLEQVRDLSVDVSHDSLDDWHIVSELCLESHCTVYFLIHH